MFIKPVTKTLVCKVTNSDEGKKKSIHACLDSQNNHKFWLLFYGEEVQAHDIGTILSAIDLFTVVGW